MNEQLNAAIAEVANGESYNHYLKAILDGEIKTLADFAAYVDAEFWGCIWDQAIDPVGTMNMFIGDLAKAGQGKKNLDQIDADMEDCFGDCNFSGDAFDNFADRMRDEVENVMTAVKYLVQEQAKKGAVA